MIWFLFYLQYWEWKKKALHIRSMHLLSYILQGSEIIEKMVVVCMYVFTFGVVRNFEPCDFALS